MAFDYGLPPRPSSEDNDDNLKNIGLVGSIS